MRKKDFEDFLKNLIQKKKKNFTITINDRELLILHINSIKLLFTTDMLINTDAYRIIKFQEITAIKEL